MSIDRPNMVVGTHLSSDDDRFAMKGATMEPIRAHVEHDPIPILRTNVGKISPAYTKIVAKDIMMKDTPIAGTMGFIQNGLSGTKSGI